MKKTAFLMLLLCSAFYFYGCDQVSKITGSGDELTIERGDNVFVVQVVGDYQEDLRIYGITDNSSSGWSPVAYADYFFTAQKFNGNIEDCERADALSASLLNIIVEYGDVEDVIQELEGLTDTRRSATVIGRKLRIKEFYYKEEDHSDSLKKQGGMDPTNAIIIDEIEILQ